jgi:hypothetical protein
MCAMLYMASDRRKDSSATSLQATRALAYYVSLRKKSPTSKMFLTATSVFAAPFKRRTILPKPKHSSNSFNTKV